MFIERKYSEKRACILCKIIKTETSFLETGCDNCEERIKLKNSRQRVQEYTSSFYEGVILVFNTELSWIAKRANISGLKKGFYAVSVYGGNN